MKLTPMNLAILAVFGFGVVKLVEAMQAKAAAPNPWLAPNSGPPANYGPP